MDARPERRLTRRELLAGGAAVAVVGAGGVVWFTDPKSLVTDLVKQKLPGVRFDNASLDRFAADFLTQWNGPSPGMSTRLKFKVAAAANGAVGTDAVASLGAFDPGDGFTRAAVTKLMLNSNFFDVPDPRSVTIVYRPRRPGTPCRSTPFGDVSPPATD